MQKIFTRYLWCVAALALFSILLLDYMLQSRNAQLRMTENARLKLDQVAQTVKSNNEELDNLMDSLGEDYLTRAHAFAYIIEQSPEILDSLTSLNRVKKLLNVDELHVIDENGILCSGTVPKYYGMDFRTTRQTEEFLQILEDPTKELVQDIQPNGAERKIFQYVGVARQDRPGIVQVGLAPVRLLKAQQKNELPYIFSRIPMDTGSCIFAVDKNSGDILAHTEESLTGRPMKALGLEEDISEELYTKGGFITRNGVRQYCLLLETDGLILGITQDEEELYAEMKVQMYLILLYLLVIFIIVIYMIHYLLQIQIVDGIHKIMEKLSEITRGNLNTVVKVENNPEFKQLSQEINQMVDSIVEATGKVSKVIDMVDVPIGVFELRSDTDGVMFTDRLRQILLWEEEPSSDLSDRQKFMHRLSRTMSKPEPEEKEIYKVSDRPEKWVKIRMTSDSTGTFGVVTDVTSDMKEKRKIRHERDYDALTGLSNLGMFRSHVEEALKRGDRLGTAAMVMLDLDHFKSVNDEFGHDWGDTYLRFTAKLLSEFDGDRGFAARRSGDEFCLFLFNYDSREEIREALTAFYKKLSFASLTFPDQSKRTVRISTGLSWVTGDTDSFDALLKRADEAMYDAKKTGRGKFREYQEERVPD